MLTKQWSSLKNGSDIRGVASEGIAGMDINLTDEAVEAIMKGFVAFLANKYSLAADKITVAIGHDSRISAQRIKAACIRAVTSVGAAVMDFSLCTTPAMFMCTIDDSLSVTGSVMLTASHLPFNRNGLKFFTPEGGLESADITEILTYAQDGANLPEGSGSVKEFDYLSRYAEHISGIIKRETGLPKPFDGMKIAVDAGNGAGGFYAEKVLKVLGADVSGSQFLEPDGTFPNHIPNPEDKDAMKAISEAVISSKSDLGVIFDTDVDRAAIVSDAGSEINKNALIALISAVLMEEKKGTVVTDSVTSTGLKDFIENSLGGVHHRFKRGYKNVINEAKRLNAEGTYAPLAIETSGHAALRENYFLDDGAYLATKIVIELARGNKFEEILSTLKMAAEEKEIRLNIKAQDFRNYGLKVIDELEKFAQNNKDCKIADDNREGIRITTPYGWILLRLSVHDPVMPLNMESDEIGGTNKNVEFFKEFFAQFDELDLSTYR